MASSALQTMGCLM